MVLSLGQEITWQTRLFAAVACMAIWFTLSPQKLGPDQSVADELSTYVKLAHLISFSAAFGSALWVTFFFGIISFFTIPRHKFGNIRSKVFPANLLATAIFCAISVASFGYHHPPKSASTAELSQLGFLLSALTFNLSNLLFFIPATLETMKEKHKAERALCIGQEVGISWKSMEAAKVNSKLAEVSSRFFMHHGFAAAAIFMYFFSLIMHSWYLADKLNL